LAPAVEPAPSVIESPSATIVPPLFTSTSTPEIKGRAEIVERARRRCREISGRGDIALLQAHGVTRAGARVFREKHAVDNVLSALTDKSIGSLKRRGAITADALPPKVTARVVFATMLPAVGRATAHRAIGRPGAELVGESQTQTLSPALIRTTCGPSRCSG
jgi:hypothetical protein